MRTMTSAATANLKGVEALLFDVFGTVVDWRRTVERELGALAVRHDLSGYLLIPQETVMTKPHEKSSPQKSKKKGGKLTLRRNGVQGIWKLRTRAIAEGAPGTTNVDTMHRQILARMLDTPGSRWQFLAAVLDDEERERLNGIWHRLDGWPDSTRGLYGLKKHVICGALSNGNVRLLVDMAKNADLPWDIVFSTELFDTFKPNPKAYQSALRHLSLEPTQCAMVAAHIWDLRGAAAVGLRTVYIPRLDEESLGVEIKTKAEGGETPHIASASLFVQVNPVIWTKLEPKSEDADTKRGWRQDRFSVSILQALSPNIVVMSSDEEAQVRTGSGLKRRKLQRACDVCRRKKIRCDGAQMLNHQCTNCADYGLECTYVESAKKRGPPKSYIERLENRVKKLQELIARISPETLEQLDNSPAAPLQVSIHNPPLPEWSPCDLAPRHLICHLWSGNSPSPVSEDEESTKFLMDDFDRMHITLDDPRYLGKSSGIMLIKLALEMKRVYMGDSVPVTCERDVKRPYINPLPVTPMQTPDFKFPDSDLMTTLIDLYFKHMNRYLPLLHRPTFESAVNSGLHYSNTSFAATLLLVCAVAAKYSDDPRVMDEPKEPGGKPDPYTSGWKWFGQVPLVKQAPISVPDVYDLQFYALIGEFLQASSVPQACWTVVGIGIRIAQDVGAHRQKRKGVRTVKDELWNRAFCFDIDMPVECDDEYWEHPDPKLCWRQPTPDKTPSVMVYFTWYIKLNQILAFLLRTLYATNKSRVLCGFVGQQWEERIVSEVDSALNSWMAKLPNHRTFFLSLSFPHFRPTTSSTFLVRWDPTRSDEVFFNQSASLYCFYQHIQILVHRPFIPTSETPTKALPFPSLAICTNAARACSTALDIQRQRFGLAPPPLTTAAFSAGVVLLLSIWGGRRSGLTTDFDKEMVNVKKCMDVLALAEVRWYLAGRLSNDDETLLFSDILNELASVGDVPLPQRGSNSPPIIPKRQRKLCAKDDDEEEYVPKSAARSSRRIRKQADSMPSRSTTGVQRTQVSPAQLLPQSYPLPEYNFDFHRPPQREQPSQPSLDPQQYWPRQTTSQPPPQKQYDTYVQPRPDASLQAQLPASVPAFGQSYRPAMYVSDPATMSSFALPRAGEMGPGVRPGYVYRMGAEAAGTVDNVGLDVDMDIRQSTGDVGLGSNPLGGTIWSDAPASFELDEWRNYISALNTQGVPPGQGPFNPTA
ncbi:hypothetical protein C0995_009645 [Termitomyces sp. Mi166|nr:hypothetical protein C0995_009645 [Termitomyces sp. Mi166\